MDAQPDIILRAFIAALASYQQDHGQECTYSLDLLPTEGPAAESQVEQPSSRQASESLQRPTSHNVSEHPLQPKGTVAAQAAEPAAHLQAVSTPNVGTEQVGLPPFTQQSRQTLNHQYDSSLGKGEKPAVGGSSSNDAGSQQAAAATAAAGGAAARPGNWKDAYQEQNSANNRQQQQPEQQQQQQSPWGYAGWSAAPNAASWGWPGYEQPYGWPPMPPPPPPAPPLPGCFMHPAAGWQQHQQVCCVCGQDISAASSQPGTAAAAAGSRDIAAVVTTLQQQLPSDVAAVPSSLAAAQAAMHKAAGISQMPDCLNNMPELLMAWFYAGYHTASLNSSSSSSSSSSSIQQ